MTHLRSQIRAAVVARLHGLPTTGDRVLVGRTRPLGRAHDPTVIVYARSEAAQRVEHGRPPVQLRTLELAVEGRVVSPTPPDAALDGIAAEIEERLALDDLGGLVLDCTLISTEIVVSADGESHVGSVILTWRVKYRAPEGVPDRTA